jgi:hypothetical protein
MRISETMISKVMYLLISAFATLLKLIVIAKASPSCAVVQSLLGTADGESKILVWLHAIGTDEISDHLPASMITASC